MDIQGAGKEGLQLCVQEIVFLLLYYFPYEQPKPYFYTTLYFSNMNMSLGPD